MMVKCFMIEPIFGESHPPSLGHEEWGPDNYIIGWKRPDTGEQKEHVRDFGVGAMWYAVWLPKNWDWENETGPHLHVCCPTGRDWDIDSRASNCAMPEDKQHRCWIRHGEPPMITVDKAGKTCSAGAGSIALPNWHGYLKNGELIP